MEAADLIEFVSVRSRVMAVVKVLPANNESAVVDSHDEYDVPLQGLSLMMRENNSNVQDLLSAVAVIHG